MLDPDELEQILLTVEELKLFDFPRRIDPVEVDGKAALEGEVNVSDHKVTIRLILDPVFPLVLPRFFIRPWDALGVLPHINRDGFICLTDPEGLILDRQHPMAIIEQAFELALQVLNDGLQGENRVDFVDEFEVYWSWLKNSHEVFSLLNLSNQVDEVTIVFEKEKQTWVAQYGTDILTFNNGKYEGSFTQQKAIYLPLEPGSVIIPPRPDIPFWTTKDARDLILPLLSRMNRVRLRKLIIKYKHIHEYVILKLPRPSGGEVLFGIQFNRVDNQHPLLEGGEAKQLIPLQIHRVDKNYLLPRGGGNLVLGAKKILLVGCGSIGGHLLIELIRAGVQDVTVIDPDILTPENTFRHVLGRRYWYQPKVKAIKEEIEGEFPYVHITTIQDTIEHVLTDRFIKLSSFDLLIMAVGKPTVELELNEKIHELQDGPSGLFTWVEPLGLGGHALLVNNVAGSGCFECLYTSMIEGGNGLENRAAFAGPGQRFGHALSGCGSLFTPYGSIDAVRTATLAVQLAIDSLTGKEHGNPLLSWKGDPTAFLKAGFFLSHRYDISEDELILNRYLYQNPHCPICKDRLS